ncbi:MAG: helix-turn-helix domain-containing protein [Pseudolabrys sp.]
MARDLHRGKDRDRRRRGRQPQRHLRIRGQLMNVRFKKTGKGEVAILSRKDYEILAAKAAEADEDLDTARLVARARREIAAGAPVIPKAVVDRIGKGENPLRVLREWRGLTQLFLCSKTAIGQGYISDLESGRRKGTAAALKKIATALNVPLDLLA